MEHEKVCLVCGRSRATFRVAIAGETRSLCATHARMLPVGEMRSYRSLAAFFERTGLERRETVDRRCEDRRMFPPRPETRRRNHGRRADDPRA